MTSSHLVDRVPRRQLTVTMFIPGVFARKSPQTYIFPQKGCQAVCSFFGRDGELQIYYGKLFLADNEQRKLCVIKQSEGCKFMPKMHQKRAFVPVAVDMPKKVHWLADQSPGGAESVSRCIKVC